MEWNAVVDLSQHWSKIEFVAREREGNRKGDGSHIPPVASDADLIGVGGEWVYATVMGYPMPTAGVPDGGVDYGECNVKGTKHRSGHLIVETRTRKWPRWFALCFIDMDLRTGWLLGWATADEVRAADRKRFREGGKWNFALKQDQLHPW